MFRYLHSRRPRVVAMSARLIAAVALLGSGTASWALGLGDIELNSALNERLRAEIELIDTGDLQPTEIIVSLASPEDFQRVGVERFYFLSDLRFEVSIDGGSLGDILVSSAQPITEPYLNFLVEVRWPRGRLLKEYTLLLDPPTFSPAPAPSVSAPSQAADPASDAGRVQRQAAQDATSGTRVQLSPRRQEGPSPLDEGVVDGEYRMTDRNDTLWSIAQRTRPSQSVSVQQNMLAIQQLNPEAFLNGNINLLKAGYRLRLPTEGQALSITDSQANQQVAMQNEDWRALRRGEPVPSRDQQVAGTDPGAAATLQAPVDATPSRSRAEPAAAGRDGELRIVAAAGDGAAGGSAAAISEQLNAAMEERDRLGREVEELTEQLGRQEELVANQVAVKDRQLEVKDQQIAEMQAQMEQMRQEMEQARLQAQTGGDQSQNQSASTSQAWWQSPYVQGGGVGALVLLLVYGMVSARRRRAAAEDDDYFPSVTEEPAFAGSAAATASSAAMAGAAGKNTPADSSLSAAGAAAAAGAGDDDADDKLLDEDELVLDIDETPARTDAGASETSDVIGEADIYIAYGRYPQAIGLLLGVLEDDPSRNDARLKLLELYAETRDRDAFDEHMTELMERCDDDEALLTARELAGQFGDGGALPGEQPMGLQLDSTDSSAADLPTLDELQDESDAGGELYDADELASDVTQTEDFELELDEPVRQDVDAAPPAGSGDALGGDLGIDFDPERDSDRHRNGAEAQDATGAGESASDDDLDLDFDDGETLDDDAFDFGDDGDTASTKLDLARAYIDMGDQDGARDILNEVVAEGSAEQQQRAQAMLEEL
jgi:pilus assembly protein FimV